MLPSIPCWVCQRRQRRKQGKCEGLLKAQRTRRSPVIPQRNVSIIFSISVAAVCLSLFLLIQLVFFALNKRTKTKTKPGHHERQVHYLRIVTALLSFFLFFCQPLHTCRRREQQRRENKKRKKEPSYAVASGAVVHSFFLLFFFFFALLLTSASTCEPRYIQPRSSSLAVDFTSFGRAPEAAHPRRVRRHAARSQVLHVTVVTPLCSA
jgi:cytochrome bd-type quinol oxidase subunit 1